MRKIFLMLVMLCVASPVFAQNRGPLPNTYASWFTVTQDQTTISFAFNSRDIFIRNGDSTEMVCVDLRGGTIPVDCFTNTTTDGGTPSIIAIDAGGYLDLEDYITSAISLKTFGFTASPVTVISNY